MKLIDVYNENPAQMGSPKMIAIFECLAGIPAENRVISPTISPISITSDGYLIASHQFLGSAEDLEHNLYGLCEFFGADPKEAEELLNNATDWRQGGNAWGQSL